MDMYVQFRDKKREREEMNAFHATPLAFAHEEEQEAPLEIDRLSCWLDGSGQGQSQRLSPKQLIMEYNFLLAFFGECELSPWLHACHHNQCVVVMPGLLFFCLLIIIIIKATLHWC